MMATKLTKPVTRECTRTKDKGRPLIVTLEPGDALSFRVKGCRHIYRVNLALCWHHASRDQARQTALARQWRCQKPRRRYVRRQCP